MRVSQILQKIEECERVFQELKDLVVQEEAKESFSEVVPVVSDNEDNLGEYSSSYSEEHRSKLLIPKTSKSSRRKRIRSDDDDDDDYGIYLDDGPTDPTLLVQSIKMLQKRGWDSFIRTPGGAEIWQHIRDVIRVQSNDDFCERFEEGIMNNYEIKNIKITKRENCYLCDLPRMCSYKFGNKYYVGRNCADFYNAIRDLINYLKNVDPKMVDMAHVIRLQAAVQKNNKKR